MQSNKTNIKGVKHCTSNNNAVIGVSNNNKTIADHLVGFVTSLYNNI